MDIRKELEDIVTLTKNTDPVNAEGSANLLNIRLEALRELGCIEEGERETVAPGMVPLLSEETLGEMFQDGKPVKAMLNFLVRNKDGINAALTPTQPLERANLGTTFDADPIKALQRGGALFSWLTKNQATVKAALNWCSRPPQAPQSLTNHPSNKPRNCSN